jgi:hypothetical protein
MMRLIALLAALNVADILATRAEIERYGEQVETNPLVSNWLTFDPATVWTIKLALCALVAVAVWRWRPPVANWLRAAVAVYGVLMVWHFAILLS